MAFETYSRTALADVTSLDERAASRSKRQGSVHEVFTRSLATSVGLPRVEATVVPRAPRKLKESR